MSLVLNQITHIEVGTQMIHYECVWNCNILKCRKRQVKHTTSNKG